MSSYPKDSPDLPNGKTVGIPRALYFHELFPLWKAFFTELGFQIITSVPTNRYIMRNGVENVIEEPCLPIKVAHGHVLDVLEKNPDFLFLPVQCTMEKLTDDFNKFWNCPLTQSLPFIVNSSKRIKEALNQASDKKPIVVRPIIHADRGRPYLRNVLRRVSRQLGMSRGASVDRAIQAGFDALDAFNDWQQKRGQEILDQLKPGEKAIIIVGRVYNTCDPGMTLNLPEKLRDLGVLAIPIDFLPLKSFAQELSTSHPNMYWKSGQKILCAGRMIAKDPRLFALYLTNFACGPDSYLVKFFGKEVEGKPFLTIEIDEHSADAGVITRCEAFIDTIRNAKTKGTSKSLEVFGISTNHTSSRRIYLPYMIDHGFVVAAAARCYGVDAVAVPPSDEQTLELGRKYTSGKECLPSTITSGDIIKETLRPDFDPQKAAFLMPTASGPCRFGQYNKLHRLILDEVGLQEVPILLFDQTKNFYQHLAALGRGFKIRAWRGATVLDYMHKMMLEKRPYEVNKGASDTVYQELLAELIKLVGEETDALESFAGKARSAFEAIQIDKSIRKPRIGIVGEIFVRSNQFANGFVVRRLEQLGAECALPPMEEWLDYIDHQRRRRSWLRLEGGRRDWVKQKISQLVQERAAEPLRKQFDGAIDCFARELGTQKILNLGRTYLSPAVEGEAILSMGRAVEYAEHGFDGIVNIMPFGCMPGTIVSILLHQFRNDYGLPIFTLAVDGTKDSGQDIRLEAFYYQCCEHMRLGN